MYFLLNQTNKKKFIALNKSKTLFMGSLQEVSGNFSHVPPKGPRRARAKGKKTKVPNVLASKET